MKKTSALVEFTLTTAMLAFWAIACAAAFQGTSNVGTGTNGSAGQAESVSLAASERATPPAAVTVEAALDAAPRDLAAAERI